MTKKKQEDKRPFDAKAKVAGINVGALAIGTGFATVAGAVPVITDLDPDEVIDGTGGLGPASFELDLNTDGQIDFILANIVDTEDGVALSFAFASDFYDSQGDVLGTNRIEGIDLGGGENGPYGLGYKAYPNNQGETVGPDSPFVPNFAKLQGNLDYNGYYGYDGYGLWPIDEQKFLGLEFLIPDPDEIDPPTTHYGFAGLTLAPETFAITLDCYGYETEPDTGIVKSCGPEDEVPVPPSLLLLAAGAVPLLAARRARRSRDNASDRS